MSVIRVLDIHNIINAWAPREISWERDNVGLQVGDMQAEVSRILVALDCTRDVVREAVKVKANLIISHHPLLFRPPRSITPRDEIGGTIRELIRKNINLYSAHTNIDFTRGGTSFALAEAIGLEGVDFLHKTYRLHKKLVTFVPETHLDTVRAAMARARAGIIGNYSECSFTLRGHGSFRGNESSNPAIGSKGRLEVVPEARLEMIVEQRNLPEVLAAMKQAHPYEEVAYDVYPLENVHADYGAGIIGSFAKPLGAEAFLRRVKTGLRAKMLRHTKPVSRHIKRVAACGGSGAELLDTAIAAGADAFITADVKYHDFHHAHGRILLVDAGHYETENPVVRFIINHLRQELKRRGAELGVGATTVSTNPTQYI